MSLYSPPNIRSGTVQLPALWVPPDCPAAVGCKELHRQGHLVLCPDVPGPGRVSPARLEEAHSLTLLLCLPGVGPFVLVSCTRDAHLLRSQHPVQLHARPLLYLLICSFLTLFPAPTSPRPHLTGTC